MDIDTAFIISGVMCIPFLTFILYFFDDKKPEGEGWKGFFKWLISFRFLDIFLGGGKKSDGGNEGMKAILIACCLSLFCGCATIETRVVERHVTIDEPYFCTCTAASMCTVIMLPQVLSPEEFELHWLNIVTVPVGACCFIVDVPFEALFDTIFYPFDVHQASKHKEFNPLAE